MHKEHYDLKKGTLEIILLDRKSHPAAELILVIYSCQLRVGPSIRLQLTRLKTNRSEIDIDFFRASIIALYKVARQKMQTNGHLSYFQWLIFFYSWLCYPERLTTASNNATKCIQILWLILNRKMEKENDDLSLYAIVEIQCDRT